MLPPVDPGVFQRNPSFEVLYRDLCTRKLDKDASTKDVRKGKVHAEIRTALRAAETRYHTRQILLSTLAALSSIDPSLPEPLPQLIDIISHMLTHPLTPSDRALLSGDVALFTAQLPLIATHLSSHLTKVAILLCTMLPLDSSSPSAEPPSISSLPTHASALLTSATTTLPEQYLASLTSLSDTTRSLLSLQTTYLATAIQHLESDLHGSSMRQSTASLAHLAARATLLRLRSELCVALPASNSHRAGDAVSGGAAPPPEFFDALRGLRKYVGVETRRMSDRVALLEEEKRVYERVGKGGKGLVEMGKRKAWLLGEMEKVRGELSRLADEGQPVS